MSTAHAVDPELLAILRCPESLQPLKLGKEAVFQQLLTQARAGALSTLGGSRVEADFEGVLIREDGMRAYLIREGIPVMLIREAVPVGGKADHA